MAVMPLQPKPFWIKQAVLGNTRSGVVVPTTIKSMSSALTPAASNAFLAAANPNVEVVSPAPATCRCLIPVRS